MGGNFHLHLPHKRQQNPNNQGSSKGGGGNGSGSGSGLGVPKGCLAIKVGQTDKEQQRFVVPVVYFNHPLFMRLLKVAEDEYGFDYKGTITIPCNVEQFRYVQGLIDREKSSSSSPHHHHHHNHQHHHNPIVGCFRA